MGLPSESSTTSGSSPTHNIEALGRQMMASIPSTPHRQVLILNDYFHYDILLYLRIVQRVRPDVCLYSSLGGTLSPLLEDIEQGCYAPESGEDLILSKFLSVYSGGSVYIAGDSWLSKNKDWNRLCARSCSCQLAFGYDYDLNSTRSRIECDDKRDNVCEARVSEHIELENYGLLWKIKEAKFKSKISPQEIIEWIESSSWPNLALPDEEKGQSVTKLRRMLYWQLPSDTNKHKVAARLIPSQQRRKVCLLEIISFGRS